MKHLGDFLDWAIFRVRCWRDDVCPRHIEARGFWGACSGCGRDRIAAREARLRRLGVK